MAWFKSRKTSSICKNCLNYSGRRGCSCVDSCIRFLPKDNTKIFEIDGAIEVPPQIDVDTATQMFINWIESVGWQFCGTISPFENT